MSARATTATAHRVALDLCDDRRTTALLLVVPVVLMTLVRFVFDTGSTFDRIGGPLLGIFPLLSMFLVTSIAMLRERTSGTLERLLTLPIGKLDILLGYALAFAAVAVLQVGLLVAVSVGMLGLDVEGSVGTVLGLGIVNALLGMSMGLFVSAFARTEFQAVQFLPTFLLPQFLLCGLLAPREDMATLLERISTVLPMTYAYDALDRVTHGLGDATAPTLVVIGFTALALCCGAATLRRRTP
jgi:ABC-2 type transport system permease protein